MASTAAGEGHRLGEIAASEGHLLLLKLWQREEDRLGRRACALEAHMDAARRDAFYLCAAFLAFHGLSLALLFAASVVAAATTSPSAACRRWWASSSLSLAASLALSAVVQLRVGAYLRAAARLRRDRGDARALARAVQELRLKGAAFDLSKEPRPLKVGLPPALPSPWPGSAQVRRPPNSMDAGTSFHRPRLPPARPPLPSPLAHGRATALPSSALPPRAQPRDPPPQPHRIRVQRRRRRARRCRRRTRRPGLRSRRWLAATPHCHRPPDQRCRRPHPSSPTGGTCLRRAARTETKPSRDPRSRPRADGGMRIVVPLQGWSTRRPPLAATPRHCRPCSAVERGHVQARRPRC